jgi:hypothetical protein
MDGTRMTLCACFPSLLEVLYVNSGLAAPRTRQSDYENHHRLLHPQLRLKQQLLELQLQTIHICHVTSQLGLGPGLCGPNFRIL